MSVAITPDAAGEAAEEDDDQDDDEYRASDMTRSPEGPRASLKRSRGPDKSIFRGGSRWSIR